ncbi:MULTISPECIES: acetyltransferase [Pseudomonas]|jgi:sugar O-acyltransferase (sialic acid O-acetyltransferase NeuD family)|uniref:Acetyltransferase n=1 Tax=Pseudomonas rhodesiae TaxID=76760 RepID=A0A8I1EB12_9PSED|nr:MULTISPECIES: acetyltransferase [Pseudomonas]MBI6605750.1 acetyltransferase [Pseudomonas sp. S4_EA_1b]MBI6627969.1 acetyltransferase [Pseudomonas rhodesiae]NMY80855.1 acetyltransferase [Pseudomonas rhodesiae]NMZ15989.1 acetyltransferase [Pseudomonas rhodesiae]
MKIYAIVGAGGFGREVIPLVRGTLGTTSQDDLNIIFVDDNAQDDTINGYRVVDVESFLRMEGEKFFNITIANSKVRQAISERLISEGATPFTVSAHNAVNLSHNTIGKGAVFCPFTTVTANAKIGKFFHANIYSYVAHDCVIGDFVTFAPNVQCNGSVVIEDHAYIGTGAMIRQGTPERPIVIGEGAVVGMGSVVTKSVAPYTTVFGNPAKPLRPASQ